MPLELPAGFDPGVAMPIHRTEEGAFHEARRAARFAADLIANGHPADLALAERVIAAVVACQEADAADPHHGNYRWMREDDVVTDLNAAAFVSCAWLPARIEHGDRVPAPLRAAWDASIRAAVAAIERRAVHLAYSNVAVMDAASRVLAARLYGDGALARRGHDRVAAWAALTAGDGHPFEFNAPTYTRITLRTLLLIGRFAERDATRRLARAAAQRLGLSVASHLHPGTGRWAGPHGRAYGSAVARDGDDGVRARVELEAPDVPAWLRRVRAAPGDVVETASRETGQTLVTHHHEDFALGSASAAFLPEANRIVLHARDGRGGSIASYARFLTDDRGPDAVRHATDRTRGRLLPDEGRAFVAQEGPRLLALYAAAGPLHGCASVASSWIVAAGAEEAAFVHVAGGVATRLSGGDTVPDEGVLVVEAGRVRTALVVLERTRLHPVPSRLVRRDGAWHVTWNHYRGPRKDFWESAWPGAYYQGPPLCGLFLEVASVNDHSSAAAFGADVDRDRPSVAFDAPVTYGGRDERIWSAHVRRGSRSLGLRVDVLGWRLLERTGRDGTSLGRPALSSPQATSGTEGRLRGFGATYLGPRGPAWLFGDPPSELWAAGHLVDAPGTVELTVPNGRVRAEAPGAATLVWDRGRVEVDGVPERGVTVVRSGRGGPGTQA